MSDEPQVQEVDAEAIEESKPAAAELVVRDRQDPQEVYRVLDRHDEEQILEELMGRALEVMVYSFSQGGKLLTDLSYAGVQEVVRTLNARRATRIRVAAEPAPLFEEVVDDGETFIQATAYAEDDLNGGGAWGTATEPKYLKLRNGNAKLDSFARTKALSKAQRNAEKALIPEHFRQMLIAMYLNDPERVRQIETGPVDSSAPDKPPLTDERADAQRAEARELYDRVKALAPGGVAVKLTPATFGVYMANAEWSHERLDDFLEFLRGKLQEAELLQKDAA